MKNFMPLCLVLLINTFSVSYAQLSHVFTYAGHVASNSAWHVAVGPDGTVFLSDPFGGLLAYDHSDASFTNLRQINDPGNEAGVTVRSDSTVFVAISRSLYAYTYDDTSITNVNSIYHPNEFVLDVAIGPDGTVFIGTEGLPPAGGILAYSFTESKSFTLLDQIFNPRASIGIAVGPDSIVYVAGRDGFYAFSFYDDSTFTQLDRISVPQAENVAVGPDGTVFFANSNTGGLLAYTFNGASFDSVTQWMDPPGALDVAVAPDGTIFLANSLDGLRAFTFDGSTLTNTAHIDPGHNTRDVAIGPGGVIYTAADNSGWNAFTYDYVTGINDDKPFSPELFDLSQNYPNPFNPSTVIRFQLPVNSQVELGIYSTTGQLLRTLVSGQMAAGSHSLVWDATDDNGTRVASGLYLYKLQAGTFTQVRKMSLLR